MADQNDVARYRHDKEHYMKEHVEKFSCDGLDLNGLKALCNKIHSKIVQLEEDKYDLEHNCRVQDAEMYELNLQLNNQRGVFVKPNLKKVSKTDMKFAKLSRGFEGKGVKVELKHSGKSKFALDEEEQKRSKSESDNPDAVTEEPAADEE